MKQPSTARAGRVPSGRPCAWLWLTLLLSCLLLASTAQAADSCWRSPWPTAGSYSGHRVVPVDLIDFSDLQPYIDDAAGPTVFVVSADVPYLPATTQVLIRKPDIIITSSLTHLTGSGGSTQGSGPTLALACDQAPGPLIQIRSKGVQIFGLSFVGCPLGALQISASQEVYVQGCRFDRNAATAVRATNSLLWLHSCTFSDNAHLAPLGPGGRMPSLAALAQAAGGAMHLIASRVLITGSTFVRNTASSVGGAVWVEGLYKEAAASGTCWASATLALSDVVLTNNSAIGPGGAVLGNNTSIHMEKVALRGNSARFGGGLYLTNSSSARLVDCRGSSNTVASSGSALYVEGAGSLLEVSRSNFTRNSATLLGGVVVVKQGAKAVLRDSSFSNNVAALAAGVVYAKEAQLVVEGATLTNNSASRDGGGLYCASACAWTVRRSTFVRNTCSGNGGALFGWNMAANVSASRFDNNSAGALGGAISMANSTVRVEDSTLLRNRANGKDAAGGGLYGQYVRFTLINNTLTDNMAAWGGGMYITNSTLSMTRDSLTDNSARQAGGGVYSLRTPSNVTGVRFDGNAAGLYGAGFYCQEGPCTLLRVRMQDQIAQVGAGGVYAAQGTLFLQNSTFVNCRAANEGAGVVLARRCTGVLVDGCNMTANSAVKGPGGAMQMVETLTVLITRSTITGNQAVDGGAVHVDGSMLMVLNSTLERNNASGAGGGIAAIRGSSIAINVSMLTNNTGVIGGAIAADSSRVVLSPLSRLVGNKANENGPWEVVQFSGRAVMPGLGGGVYANVATLIAEATARVENNSATHVGGGVYADVSEVQMNGTVVASNAAGDEAGGIKLSHPLAQPVSRLVQARITDNTAPRGGGLSVVAADVASMLLLDNCTIARNAAEDGPGGGLYGSGPLVLKVMGGVFANNTAAESGGGLAVQQGQWLGLHGCSITGNVAGVLGGGMWLDQCSVAVLNRTNMTGNRAATGGGAALVSMQQYLGLQNCSISGNQATGTSDAQPTVDCTTAGAGGGLCASVTGTLVINDTRITSNSAKYGGGGVLGVCPNPNTCGIALSDNTYTNNSVAGGGGGALYLTSALDLRQLRCGGAAAQTAAATMPGAPVFILGEQDVYAGPGLKAGELPGDVSDFPWANGVGTASPAPVGGGGSSSPGGSGGDDGITAETPGSTGGGSSTGAPVGESGGEKPGDTTTVVFNPADGTTTNTPTPAPAPAAAPTSSPKPSQGVPKPGPQPAPAPVVKPQPPAAAKPSPVPRPVPSPSRAPPMTDSTDEVVVSTPGFDPSATANNNLLDATTNTDSFPEESVSSVTFNTAELPPGTSPWAADGMGTTESAAAAVPAVKKSPRPSPSPMRAPKANTGRPSSPSPGLVAETAGFDPSSSSSTGGDALGSTSSSSFGDPSDILTQLPVGVSRALPVPLTAALMARAKTAGMPPAMFASWSRPGTAIPAGELLDWGLLQPGDQPMLMQLATGRSGRRLQQQQQQQQLPPQEQEPEEPHTWRRSLQQAAADQGSSSSSSSPVSPLDRQCGAFADNTVSGTGSYGPIVVGQPAALKIEGPDGASGAVVSIPSGDSIAVRVVIVDQFGTLVSSGPAEFLRVRPSLSPPGSSSSSTASSDGVTLSDNRQLFATNGSLVLDGLKVNGAPGTTLQLWLLPSNSRVAPAVLSVELRRCAAGSIPFLGDCEACPMGYYSLVPTQDGASCSGCPAGALCNGSVVLPVPGVWHSHPRSVQMHECWNPAACARSAEVQQRLAEVQEERYGSQTVVGLADDQALVAYEQGQCAPGYTGRMCGRCDAGSDGARFGRLGGRCVDCGPRGTNIALYVLSRLFDLAICSILAWLCQAAARAWGQAASSAAASAAEAAAGAGPSTAKVLPPSAMSPSVGPMRFEASLYAHTQVLLDHLQLLSIVACSMAAYTWPRALSSFVSGVAFTPLSTSKWVSLECLLPLGSYVPHSMLALIITAAVPLLYLGAAAAAYFRSLVMGRTGRRELLVVVVFMGWFYPLLTWTGLTTFQCARLDRATFNPGEVARAVGWFWMHDPGLQCYTRPHLAFMLGFGLPLVLLVGVGWPVLLGFVVQGCSRQLNPGVLEARRGRLHPKKVAIAAAQIVGATSGHLRKERRLWVLAVALRQLLLMVALTAVMAQPALLQLYTLWGLLVLALLAEVVAKAQARMLVRVLQLWCLTALLISVYLMSGLTAVSLQPAALAITALVLLVNLVVVLAYLVSLVPRTRWMLQLLDADHDGRISKADLVSSAKVLWSMGSGEAGGSNGSSSGSGGTTLSRMRALRAAVAKLRAPPSGASEVTAGAAAAAAGAAALAGASRLGSPSARHGAVDADLSGTPDQGVQRLKADGGSGSIEDQLGPSASAFGESPRSSVDGKPAGGSTDLQRARQLVLQQQRQEQQQQQQQQQQGGWSRQAGELPPRSATALGVGTAASVDIGALGAMARSQSAGLPASAFRPGGGSADYSGLRGRGEGGFVALEVGQLAAASSAAPVMGNAPLTGRSSGRVQPVGPGGITQLQTRLSVLQWLEESVELVHGANHPDVSGVEGSSSGRGSSRPLGGRRAQQQQQRQYSGGIGSEQHSGGTAGSVYYSAQGLPPNAAELARLGSTPLVSPAAVPGGAFGSPPLASVSLAAGTGSFALERAAIVRQQQQQMAQGFEPVEEEGHTAGGTDSSGAPVVQLPPPAGTGSLAAQRAAELAAPDAAIAAAVAAAAASAPPPRHRNYYSAWQAAATSIGGPSAASAAAGTDEGRSVSSGRSQAQHASSIASGSTTAATVGRPAGGPKASPFATSGMAAAATAATPIPVPGQGKQRANPFAAATAIAAAAVAGNAASAPSGTPQSAAASTPTAPRSGIRGFNPFAAAAAIAAAAVGGSSVSASGGPPTPGSAVTPPAAGGKQAQLDAGMRPSAFASPAAAAVAAAGGDAGRVPAGGAAAAASPAAPPGRYQAYISAWQAAVPGLESSGEQAPGQAAAAAVMPVAVVVETPPAAVAAPVPAVGKHKAYYSLWQGAAGGVSGGPSAVAVAAAPSGGSSSMASSSAGLPSRAGQSAGAVSVAGSGGRPPRLGGPSAGSSGLPSNSTGEEAA